MVPHPVEGHRHAALAIALRHQRRLQIQERWLSGQEPAGSIEPAILDAWCRSIARTGVAATAIGDPDYPALLAQIPDPPLLLYGRGTTLPADARCVAIVGSRRASADGLVTARHCAAALAGRGIVVVSGLAAGIDSAAHAGAIEALGLTIAVLGSGPDRIYPAHNRSLAERISGSRGLLLSEYEPGTAPRKHHFPERNRIISGLSEAVLVVEASERSGSLITARMALEQGRDVFAVPGSIRAANSRGCHRLIREGAALIDSVETLLEELGFDPAASPVPVPAAGAAAALHPDVLAQLQRDEPVSAETVASRMRCPLPDTLLKLMELEIAGFVAAEDGGYIRITAMSQP